jgi:hypothetical protein
LRGEVIVGWEPASTVKRESPFGIAKRALLHVFKTGGGTLGLFHCGSLCSPNGLCQFHPFLDRRFREKRTLLYFLQDAGPLILFLEPSNSAIDRFVFTNDNADQEIHLLRVLTILVLRVVD